ncbi:hypothetical protein D9M71_465130 [compost metagenome]
MEVGDQGIDHMEWPAWEDEDIGVAAERLELAITGGAFQRAHAGGAHGYHPPATGAARGHGVDHILADLQPLFMHVVVFDALDPHWLEGTSPHVQGDEGGFHAFGGDLGQQLFIEVQAGGWRGHGASALGVHRLVALAVGALIRTVDVRRQRHMADAIEQWQHLFGKTQLEQRIVTGDHLGLATAVDDDRRARLGRLARTYVGQYPVAVEYALDEDLQLAAAGLLAEQTRRNHPGIVEHHQIARAQMLEQVGELAMRQCPARPVQGQ